MAYEDSGEGAITMKHLKSEKTASRKKLSAVSALILSIMLIVSLPLRSLAVADTVYPSGTYTVYIYVNGAHWHGVTYTFAWASKPSFSDSYNKPNTIYISGGDQWMGLMSSPCVTSKTAADGASYDKYIYFNTSIALAGLEGYHYYAYASSQTQVRNSIASASNTGISFAFNTSAVGLKTSENVKYENCYMVVYYASNTGFIRYNPNGGGGVMNDQSFAYGTGGTMAPNTYYRDGYEFAGWNTSPDGSGTSVGNCGAIPGSWALYDGQWTTVYAQWKKVNGITYNSNGGKLADNHGADIVVDADGTIRKNGVALTTQITDRFSISKADDPSSVNLTRPGYHLNKGAEWTDSSAGSGREYDQAATYFKSDFAAETRLYANWKPNKYTVRFHPNADNTTGMMPDQEFLYDTDAKAQSNSFINPGFKLVGWDKDPEAEPGGKLDIRGDKGSVHNLTAENNGTVDLYAVWRPISEAETDINAGKILKSGGKTDAFTFRIEPVEGWRHENELTTESGQRIDAADMPMPEETPEGQRYKDVTVTGIAGNVNVLRSQSFGLISFEEPGWYMYKVSEVIPENPDSKISYDKSSYYVVVYVEYKDDEGYKVQVRNTTAWHNTEGSGRNRPDLSDISEITDNGGKAASANEENVFGKTESGTNSVLVRFWNEEFDDPDEIPGSLRIMKNVTGSLGDLTKQFEFNAKLGNLSPNTTYSVVNDGANLDSGFEGTSFRTDASGNAVLRFRMKDDDNFSIKDLSDGASVDVTEYKSDHRPSFVISDQSGEIRREERRKESELSTGTVSLKEGKEYTILFENNRELAENTGFLYSGAEPLAVVFITGALLILISIFIGIKRRRIDNE